jgi:hypothetical protein
MLLQRKVRRFHTRVPGGLIAQTEKGYFLVKGSKRFRFASERARVSWNLKVVPTTELAMRDIKISGIVGFRDGTLIRDISTHKIYLISDYKKRHVVAPEFFKNLGYSMNDVILVSSKEAGVHQEGVVLNG